MSEQRLNAEQQKIFDAVIQSKKNFILIQGKGGTGKSFFVKRLQQKLGCNILVPTKLLNCCWNPGADVNVVEQNSNTALMCAARIGNIEIVKLLRQYGAEC